MFLKKIITFVSLIFWSTNGFAQYGFDVTKDEQSGQTMFVGRCTFDDLSDEKSFDWITLGSNEYNPESAITDQLKKSLPSCDIVIFMGTWCDDTHNLLPKLYKTMLLSRCYTNYKMFAVDRNKKSKENEQTPYKIEHVPTIIVLRNGIELGRIVEMTKTTIEKDLLNIIQGTNASK